MPMPPASRPRSRLPAAMLEQLALPVIAAPMFLVSGPALVEAAWHYLTCSGRPKGLAKGQAPDRGARRHAAKGVRRLVERRGALLARGVHGNKANVATARELACWVWAVGLMAEEA